MNSLRSNLLLVVFSLCVSFGVAEIALRVFGVEPLQSINWKEPNSNTNWGKRDEEIGWINNPGVHNSVEFGNEPMTFWSGGRRASRPVENAECGASILLIGDSWTQGYGVRDEDTYGWMLGGDHPEFCFENFGNGGYGALQTLLLLDRTLSSTAQTPPLVILGFTSYMAARDVVSYGRLKSMRVMGNDVYFPPFVRLEAGALKKQPPYRSLAWPMERNSAVLNLVHNGYHQLFTTLNRGELDNHFATMQLLREIAERVKAAGSRFLFVWLQTDSLNYDRYNQFLSSQKIETINCESSEGFAPRLRVGGDGHPNGEYHRYIATCIGEWLSANL